MRSSKYSRNRHRSRFQSSVLRVEGLSCSAKNLFRTVLTLYSCLTYAMPRATSEKLTRLHAPSAASGKGKEKAGSAKSSSNGSSGGGAIARDPLHKLDLYGQHFLHAQGTCQAIVTKANLRSTDTCLEVGPGLGALTKLILPQVKKLTAIEMDPRMAAEVQKQVQGR